MSSMMLFLFWCLLIGFTIANSSGDKPLREKTTDLIHPRFRDSQNAEEEESKENREKNEPAALGGGEEMSEETATILELMRIKRDVTHWNVSISYGNSTTKTTLRKSGQSNESSTPPTVNQVLLITGSPIPIPTEMMVMEASKVRAPLFVNGKSSPVHVTRTVRYRTWVSNSNESVTEVTPNHTGSASAEHSHFFAPSNQQIIHGISPDFVEKNIPIPVIYTTRRRPEIRYYVPRKEASHLVYQNKRRHPNGRGRIQLIQPVEDYDDDVEPVEDDEESSEEEEEQEPPPPPPRYNKNRNPPQQIPVFTEPPQVTVKLQPTTSSVEYSTNAISSTVGTNTVTSTTTSVPAVVVIPPPIGDTESSHKKQVYLEHPVAYLMAHLPTSTLPPLPTHPATPPPLPTHSSPSETNFSPTHATNIAVTSPAPQNSDVIEQLPISPTQNSIESAESPEDYADADYDDRPNRSGETKYKSTRSQPEADYDDEDVDDAQEPEEEEEEEEDEEEEVEEPQPIRVQQRERHHQPRVHYRRRPRVKKVRQEDYQEDYEDVRQVPQQKPVTIYVQRARRPKAKPVYQEYVEERPTQTLIKGGRYRNQGRRNRLRHKPVIQLADANDYYANNNNLQDPRKPNIIIAYEPESSANHGHRTQKLVLANVNLPLGKIKWLRQLDHSKNKPHPHNLRNQATIYQTALHNKNNHPQKSMQPVYTPHNIHSVPHRIDNSTRHRGNVLVPSAVKSHGRYVQLVPAIAYSKPHSTNDLQEGDYYAIVDNSGRLNPARLVVQHSPPKENAYQVYQTHRKPQTQVDTYQCDWSYCRLPDCFCGTNALIPGNLKVTEVPQMILLTFDDSINEVNFPFYKSLFHSRKNPNGCPIKATFYVSHEWTDYSKVQMLYAQGHEMASHSISHSDGARFGDQRWADEILGQKEILATLGGVRREDIRGMRAPFLQPGGDHQYSMLQATNFTYDSSLPIRRTDPPIWPYTLDYGVPHECNIAPCPKGSYPGLWEVPLIMWTDLSGGRCSMADACSASSEAEDVYRMLMLNFERHYRTNKSPFPMYFHYAWFTKKENFEAFAAFVDTVLQLGDVYFVTTTQMINWMKHPTPISRINDFAQWNCSNETQNVDTCIKSTMCTFQFQGSERSARTCQKCPPAYPWVGNPRGLLLAH